MVPNKRSALAELLGDHMPEVPQSIRFIRLPQVKDRTGLSRSSIYAMIALGQFPPAVHLGARAVAWVESEVDAWMSGRLIASREGLR